MKKILFTGVMLLSFAAAQAGVNVAGEEPVESEVTISVVEEMVAESRNAVFMSEDPECYQLSCGVACTSGGAIPTDEECDIECVFDILEAHFCG